jgi:beta-glucosidase
MCKEFQIDSARGVSSPRFVNYTEGIYVGYRFWEMAADEGLVDYDASVQYPFGYGLSYTTFTQEMSPIQYTDGTVSFTVTVTNTGSAAGKDVVGVYGNPPYTNGGIEKGERQPHCLREDEAPHTGREPDDTHQLR